MSPTEVEPKQTTDPKAVAGSSLNWRREVGLGATLGLVPLLAAAIFHVCLGDSFSLCVDDGVSSHQPLFSDTLRQLHSGNLPLWSDHTCCGGPLFARGQSVSLYPPLLLAHAICLGLNLGACEVVVAYLLYLWAGTLFAWLYLRNHGCRVWPALLGTLAFAFAGPSWGFWNNWPYYGSFVASVPAALLILDRLRVERSSPYLVVSWSLLCGLQLLLADPQLIVKFFLLCGLHVLFRFPGPSAGRPAGRSARRRAGLPFLRQLALGTGLAGLMATAQVAATWQLLGSTQRVTSAGVPFDDAFMLSLKPQMLQNLFVPFGQFDWQSSFEGYPTLCGGLFVGPLLPLAVAAIVVWQRRWQRPEGSSEGKAPTPGLTLVCLLGLYAVLALGKYWPANASGMHLPLFRQFRWPMRWTAELCSLAALATGLGLEVFRQHWQMPQARWLLLGTLLLVPALLLPANPTNLIGLAWLASGAVLFLLLRQGRQPAFFAVATAFSLATLLAAVPLAQRNRFVDPDLRDLVKRPIPLEPTAPQRVLVLVSRTDQKDARGEGNYFYNVAHQFGGRTVVGYAYPLQWQTWAQGFRTGGELLDEDLAVQRFLSPSSPGCLRMLRIGLVVVPRNNPRLNSVCQAHPDLVQETPTEHFCLYRHTGFHQSAWFVEELRTDEPDAEALTTRDVTRVCSAPTCSEAPRRLAAGGAISNFEENNGRISMTLDRPDPGFVVIGTTWFPGWEARVDGRPTPVCRVNGGFLGVATPGGARSLELVYRPVWLIALLALNTLVFLAALVYWAVATFRLR